MRRERGAALLEFALTAMILYLLVAGGVELGRMIYISQVLQDAARVAARELSVTPLSANYQFDCPSSSPPNSCVLNDETVVAQIWNSNLLVIDLACYPSDPANPDPLKREPLTRYLNSLPLVNRALQPAFISETLNPGEATERRLLRYPGALVSDTSDSAGARPCPEVYAPDSSDPVSLANPTDLTVKIFRVSHVDGGETIDPNPVPIVAEVRSDPNDANCGPFSLSAPMLAIGECGGVDPATLPRGIAAVAVNYPFQSAALSGFRSAGFETSGPNVGAPKPNASPENVIESNDVIQQPPDNVVSPLTYSGPNGLGNQYALGKQVRPYRSLLLGQAMYRREVIQ